jgi:hypothetical protein
MAKSMAREVDSKEVFLKLSGWTQVGTSDYWYNIDFGGYSFETDDAYLLQTNQASIVIVPY